MPKPKYWGVECNRNRHGRLRWYFRKDRDAPRIRLPDSYGSDLFERAWRAAVAGHPLPLTQDGPGAPMGGRRVSRGSLDWLIRLYLQSDEFKTGRPTTQRIRRGVLEKLAADKGSVSIEDIDQATIKASLDARKDTPHMARAWLGCVNAMFAWATAERLPDPVTGAPTPILAASPCAGMKRLPLPKPEDPEEETGHPTWSEDDLAAFEAAYPLGTRERLVYSVLLYTGLRLGDAARLGRQHVQKEDGTLKIVCEKNRVTVHIAIVEPLKLALAAGPHGDAFAFIPGARGRPIPKGDLGKWFGARCRAIGLSRSAHGLRKAAARRYAEAGATESQLMAIFGWQDARIAQLYVRMASRKKMALDAQRGMRWAACGGAVEAEAAEQNVLLLPPPLLPPEF
jgi:integrase